VRQRAPYLTRLYIVPDRIASHDYPLNLPRIRTLDLPFDPAVTFFVGENGTETAPFPWLMAPILSAAAMPDLRFAIRALRATPVVTAVAILSLALVAG
jgi:hypothetical protein